MRRRRYENPAGGTESPVDDLLDVAHQSVSLAVREMCGRIGIDSGSFTRAAANLERVVSERTQALQDALQQAKNAEKRQPQ